MDLECIQVVLYLSDHHVNNAQVVLGIFAQKQQAVLFRSLTLGLPRNPSQLLLSVPTLVMKSSRMMNC